MVLHRYACRRPMTAGTVPPSFQACVMPFVRERKLYYGWIDRTEPLSAEDVERYDLAYMGEADGRNHVLQGTEEQE